MPFMTNENLRQLPPWMQVPYQHMVERTNRWASTQSPAYAQERLAEIPEELQDAHSFIQGGFGEEKPILDEAGQQIRGSMQPFYQNSQNYMNPYNQHVVRQIAEEGNRNFTQNVMPALEAKFIRLGQHGSSRHQQLSERAARDMQHEVLNRQQQALASGYQQAGQMYNAQQARQLEGANQLAGLAGARQGSRFADIASLEGVGRYRQQQQQAANDIRYQNWLREQESPLYRSQQQAAVMQGIPAQGISLTIKHLLRLK
jgi:hypothetical protein